MKGMFGLIIVCAVIIGGFLWYDRSSDPKNTIAVDAHNVTIEDGTQIISISAKGGYQPRKSVAKSEIPTVIRFNTNGTFDCSLAVRIPSLGISKTLAQTGSTNIDIGTQKPGTLKGTCGMGMYPFEINFTS